MNIEFTGNNALVEVEDMVFSFEVSETPRDFAQSRKTGHDNSLDWSNGTTEQRIGQYRVLPYGHNNDLPNLIKEIVQSNSHTPSALKKKTGMLWGKGPKLYREVFDDNHNLIREWVEDSEVEDWMESWGAEEYLMKGCVDYNHIEGTWTKFYNNKGARIGKNKIAKLEHVPPSKARHAALASTMEIDPTHVILTDWGFHHMDHLTKYKVYRKFDFQNPFAAKNSIMYSNMYSFCTDYYTVPDIYGSLEWIKRSTAVPLILKALSKHGINAKYHIESPGKFWQNKQEIIEKNCERKGIEYKHDMLKKYMTEYLRKFAKALSGELNSGKFIHTIKEIVVDGTDLIEQGWTIKPIDQNIKDFVDAQLKIGDRSDRAAAASVGLSSSTGNAGKENTTNSGSERIYALQEYLMTSNTIPEMIVTKALNYALKINFKEKKLKCGFYRQSVQREEEKTAKDRMKAQDS